MAHLRANLWLLILTLGLCCVLYPLVLWLIGMVVFPHQAEGSILEVNNKPVGSRLIAQSFQGDEYFQPRPSAAGAAGYNASASGASNWGPSNYLLRDRVARTLGPIVRYQGKSLTGKTVQEDIADWFKTRPNLVAEWAQAHEGVAQAWVNADDKHKEAVSAWMKTHEPEVTAWKKANPGQEPKPADLAQPFFLSNAAKFHKDWPKLIDDSSWSVPAVFFDSWLQDHPEVKLEQVPADMVMASGSGLDPHITLKNAHYQLPRIVDAWAKKIGADKNKVHAAVAKLLEGSKEAPLGGLAGVPLINVLEVNLALPKVIAGIVR
jgi:potassium-transporting ATPase KdpC subunit